MRSRCGCIITFGGAPVVWKSQLIKEICLSATHAECVGLSNAPRALIPIRNLIMDALEQLQLPMTAKPTMSCKVFEDDQAAFTLAVGQRETTRTKHLDVKCHWFWQFVYREENLDGWLRVEKNVPPT